MELLRADLVLGVELADGSEATFSIRDVNAAMSDVYVGDIANIIKDTFEIKGQNITKLNSIDIIHTQKKSYATV